MVKIIPSTPSPQTLKNIYDVCNEIFKDESLFYSKEEVKELKQNKDNIFIK
jgi:hypothetical protein